MRQVESTEDLYNIIRKADDVTVVLFSGRSCPTCSRAAVIMKDLEPTFEGRVSFIEASNFKAMKAFSEFQITKVPTILFCSKEVLSDRIHVHSKLIGKQITRGSIMFALGRCMKNIQLR